MMLRFSDYIGEYRVLSLALDECTKEDLSSEHVECLYVCEDSIVICPDEMQLLDDLHQIEQLRNCNNYDVFELWKDGSLHRCYDDSSIDNYFFVTAKCNSNCVMCPSSDISRKSGENGRVESLIGIAQHIPVTAPHLTVTGGEPFMVGDKIFDFFSFLKRKFSDTEVLVLTNGRIFAIERYAEEFYETSPDNCIVAIPVHGSSAEIHDGITRAKDSFAQTMLGTKRLLRMGMRVELRIVVSKLNVDDFDGIVELIINELAEVAYVSVMAMEMTGNAYVNRERVWMPYGEIGNRMRNGIIRLVTNGVNVRIYNFPLCTVPKDLWPLCEKSISPNKVRFAPVCDACEYRNACGGVFAGTYQLERNELTALI